MNLSQGVRVVNHIHLLFSKKPRSTMPQFEGAHSSTDGIALLKKRLSGFDTEEGRLSGLAYKPKSGDEVIITTTPKAGASCGGGFVIDEVWMVSSRDSRERWI